MNKLNAAIAMALVAGCAATSTEPAPNAATHAVSTDAAAEPGPTSVAEVDIADINRLRCEPLTRPGTRIVVAERCYLAGRHTVDEEALAEQLEQVRRDQEELDRRRREAEARRGPGL
jgi:hypothetical protein